MENALADLPLIVDRAIDGNKTFQVLKTDVGVLKSDVGVLKSDVGVLKSDVGVLKTDIAVLKTDIAVLKTDIAVLKTDVKTLKSDVRVLWEMSHRQGLMLEQNSADLKQILEVMHRFIERGEGWDRHSDQIKLLHEDIDLTKKVVHRHVHDHSIHKFPRKSKKRKADTKLES